MLALVRVDAMLFEWLLVRTKREVQDAAQAAGYFCGALNTMEDVFSDPYAFDVARTNNDHVTFGKGSPHFCLGSALARLELRIMFEELLPRLAGIELAGDVRRVRSNFVNGIKSLPVTVTLT